MSKYDIAIVYAPEDASRAQTLKQSITKYTLPKGVAKPRDLDYSRIYLDCSDNGWNDTVRETLDRTEYILCLCSPYAKNNASILSRLEYFMENYGRDHVIACIIEGEPRDSFPPIFIEEKVTEHLMPDMTVVKRSEIVEPVASDLRGSSDREKKEKLRYETVRIVASVLGMHPDELERRQERRRSEAIKLIVGIVAVTATAVSALFIVLGIKAYREAQIATAQTEQAKQLAERLVDELPRQFSDDEAAEEIIYDIIEDVHSDLASQGMEELLGREE